MSKQAARWVAILGMAGCVVCHPVAWGMGKAMTSPLREDSSRQDQVFRTEERLHLHVPASFEGRTAKEWRKSAGLQIFDGRVRVERVQSKVQLRGLATIFDFDYKRDRLDLEIFRSKSVRPGYSACLDCHGGSEPRTTVTIGQETTSLEPKPVVKGLIRFTIDDGLSESGRIEVRHWVNNRLKLRGEARLGHVQQGRHDLDAAALTLGVQGRLGHRLTWDSALNVSKVESYRRRRTFLGNLSYRFGRRLRVTFGGGAFLDGYTQFGTDMSEMGLMSVGLEKDDPQLLPSLFQRLKDDRFGFLKTTMTYEYLF
jgi:hypothetical protein